MVELRRGLFVGGCCVRLRFRPVPFKISEHLFRKIGIFDNHIKRVTELKASVLLGGKGRFIPIGELGSNDAWTVLHKNSGFKRRRFRQVNFLIRQQALYGGNFAQPFQSVKIGQALLPSDLCHHFLATDTANEASIFFFQHFFNVGKKSVATADAAKILNPIRTRPHAAVGSAFNAMGIKDTVYRDGSSEPKVVSGEKELSVSEIKALHEKLSALRTVDAVSLPAEKELRSFRALVAYAACDFGINESVVIDLVKRHFGVVCISELDESYRGVLVRFLENLDIKQAIN